MSDFKTCADMKKMKLGVDVDNVLCDMTTLTAELLKEMHDMELPPEGQTSYYLYNFLPLTREQECEIFYRYHTEKAINATPLPNAIEKMRRLAEFCDLYIITARTAEGETQTEEWLKKLDIPFTELHFSKQKVKKCKDLGIELMIEDKGSTASGMASAGIPCILFDYAYNREHESDLIHRVRGWDEAYDVIESHYMKRAA